jgi:hypothetical protein
MTAYLWVMFIMYVLAVCTNPLITGLEGVKPNYQVRFLEHVAFAIWTAVLLFGGK